MLRCADNTLYTGVTTDVERRVNEHNGLGAVDKGAKYTKPRRPVALVYTAECVDRSEAGKAEAALRMLSKKEKQTLCQQYALVHAT